MSLKPSAFAELLQTSLSSRTVYVKCVPPPVNFYERRAVLRTLQQSSQEAVETFKKLEDNSSFVVVTSKPEAATAMVNESPITRVVIAQASKAAAASNDAAWGARHNLRGTLTAPVDPLPPSDATQKTPTFDHLGLAHRSFTLHVFAANKTYSHKEVIRRNPLHGPWPPNDGETFMSAALYMSIPSGAMAPGLRDWHTANQLSRDSTSFADEGPQGAAAVLLGKQRPSSREAFLMERIRARWNEKETPAVMKSLAAFADGKATDASPDLNSTPNSTSQAPEDSGA
ncbi:hypothetical protein GGR52DRAFT_311942 [Hypoxylon sp. FL1284]|nr:hypothetical protein GGR52DRAFT_311942 [Hypoxylon sp. FL1284]